MVGENPNLNTTLWLGVFCGTGNLDGLHLLKKRSSWLDLTPLELGDERRTPAQSVTALRTCLTWACSNGHVPVARWLHSTFALTIDDRDDDNFRSDILYGACQNGQLAAVQWLFSTYVFTKDDIRAPIEQDLYNANPLVGACYNGHLHIVEWLDSKFEHELTSYHLEDPSHEDEPEHALVAACMYGHLATAQYLENEFEFSGTGYEDINLNVALRGACENGHFAVAQWLHSTYELDNDAGRSESNYAIRMACENGHFKIVQWLCSTYYA